MSFNFDERLTLLLYTFLLGVELYAKIGTNQVFKAMQLHEGPVADALLNARDYQYCMATSWNFVLQIFFLIVAIIDELSKLLSLPSGIQKLLSKSRAFIFNGLVFPGSALVVFTFWSIWAVDRELVFPKIMDAYFPMWLNHVLHTFILIPLAIEILLPKKDNFIKFKNAAPVLIFYASVYQVLYFWIYIKDGVWLYPIYKVLSIPQMVLFNIIQVALLLGFQYLGISLQNTKMRKAVVEKKKVK